MQQTTGHVFEVVLIPGRTDALKVVFGDGTSNVTYTARFSAQPDGAVYVNGNEYADPGDLFTWLCRQKNGVSVTVHPCPERYNLSLRTEFVSNS